VQTRGLLLVGVLRRTAYCAQFIREGGRTVGAGRVTKINK